jgi:hypothetical protein
VGTRDAGEFIHEHIRVGKQGHLFLTVGSNNVLRQYTKDGFNLDAQCQWRLLIAARARALRRRGVTYRHMFVPEKLTIYDNLYIGPPVDVRYSPAAILYRHDPYYREHPLRLINVVRCLQRRAQWRRTVVDLVGPMRRVRDATELYRRTDSHWTFAGCELACFELCRSLGVDPHRDFAQREAHHFPDGSGDLGAACVPPRLESMTFISVQKDSERFYANPLVDLHERMGTAHLLHLGAHVAYRNARPRDGRRLLLFGDSYAHFAPFMLTIMLAETFREVHFVWSTSLDWSLIDRIAPDIVVTEMAERFAVRLPDDRFDLDACTRERCDADPAAAARPLHQNETFASTRA